MLDMDIVLHPDQLTPKWLTRVLNQAGYAGTVSEISWHSIGAGQVGENARFELTGSGDLPDSVVGKFPSTDPTSKQTAIQLNNYAREVFFYTDLAATVDIQTPIILATEFDPKTHDFAILMEDLAPGKQIDQMSECTVDQGALALEELAKLHGPRWGDTSLANFPLLIPQPLADIKTPLYCLLQEGFLQRYAHRLTANEQKSVTEFGSACAAENYNLYDCPATLIHIDYRLDNMIFGGPHPLTVLDWQSINLGCAINDVSYFMGTSLSTEQRAKEERALLKHYLEQLRSFDVQLSWDAFWDLYRRYAPAGLNMAVIASMIVGETKRGNDMFMTMATRSAAMCDDLETLLLLSD